MKAIIHLKVNQLIFISTLLCLSCNVSDDDDFHPPPEGADITTAIWVSFDDILYRIDDVRSSSYDYSTPYPMEVIAQIDLNGITTNGVRILSNAAVFSDANGRLRKVNVSSFENEDLADVGIGYVAPILTADFSSFLARTDGEIFKLDSNGDVEWMVSFDDDVEFHSSPCLIERAVLSESISVPSKLVIGSTDGNLRALYPQSGELIWTFATDGPIYSNPIKYNSVPEQHTYDIIVGSDDGSVYSVRGIDGSLVWQFETDGAVRSSPTINHWIEPDWQVSYTDPLVYFGSDDGKLYAVHPTTGDLRWSFQTGGPVRSSPYFLVTSEVFFDQEGLVFVGSDDGKLYCFQSHTGILEWTRDLDSGPIQSSPVALRNGLNSEVVSRNTVYVSTTKGLFGLDTGTGEILSQKLIPSESLSSPVVLKEYGEVYWEGPWYPSNHSVFY